MITSTTAATVRRCIICRTTVPIAKGETCCVECGGRAPSAEELALMFEHIRSVKWRTQRVDGAVPDREGRPA